MMIRGRKDRRRAQSLQDALERYERALNTGADAASARAQAGEGLGDLGRSFALAVALGDAGREIVPDEAFARRVAMQLRTAPAVAGTVRRAPSRRAPRFSLAPLALAAATVIVAVVLIPSLRALPGEPLYAVKGAAEDARIWWARDQGEARVRLGVADERFEEVERLIDRSRVVVSGPGISAAAAADIADPEIARLIEQALDDAGRQLEAAADILTSQPAPQEDIEELLVVTQRGREITAEVAHDLPTKDKPPVLRTGVKLAKIEAQAKAAQTTAEPVEQTPPPCATPTPTPTPTASPSPTPANADDATPTASPTPTPPAEETDATPDAEPTSEPEATPCVSPSPSPSPSPTPSPTAEPEESPASPPSDAASEQEPGVEEEPGGQGSDVPDDSQPTSEPGWPPFFQRA